MNTHLRQLIFKPINYYVFGILVAAVIFAVLFLGEDFSIPDWTTWLIGTGFMLLVWQCGIRMPYLGMISMERLIQFHLLLTLPISETLLITTVATFVMPFINKSYRMNSYHIALIRALNNLAMNTIMLLSTYWFLNHWLILPLSSLDSPAIYVIIAAAIIMQIINIGMIFIYFSFDRKKVSKLFTPSYLFADFIFVPAGVLSAMLWQSNDPVLFYLFATFMLVLLISFYSFNRKEPENDAVVLNKGTEYPASFLDVGHVTTAIKSRCDQLFNCQAMFLVELESNEQFKNFLIDDNQSSLSDLKPLVNQLTSDKGVELGQQSIQGKIIDYMLAMFKDHNGFFAKLVLVRVNQVAFLNSDLNLLRLFVQRYRPGLSYALTFTKLSEYKNNLEQKVKSRTQQLEAVNQEKSELVNKLKLISNSDALSKLFNRRYFDSLIRHIKLKTPAKLSLAIIDIDHFKKINDSYGHDIGDQVIKSIAQVMKTWANGNITLVRYGGEEFVVLFKNMDHKLVISALNKLIEEVRSHDWSQLKVQEKLTISIGLAHYPGSSIEQLFEHADSAMYQAKANGRNQLVLYQSNALH